MQFRKKKACVCLWMKSEASVLLLLLLLLPAQPLMREGAEEEEGGVGAKRGRGGEGVLLSAVYVRVCDVGSKV